MFGQDCPSVLGRLLIYELLRLIRGKQVLGAPTSSVGKYLALSESPFLFWNRLKPNWKLFRLRSVMFQACAMRTCGPPTSCFLIGFIGHPGNGGNEVVFLLYLLLQAYVYDPQSFCLLFRT